MLARFSLTSRLTWLFTAVAAIVSIGLGALVMASTNDHFVDLDKATLRDKKQLILEIVRNAHSAQDLQQRLADALQHHHGLYVYIRTPDGQALYTTPTDSSHSPKEPNAAPGGGAHGTASQGPPQKWRTLQFEAVAAYAPQTGLQTTLRIDTAHHDWFLMDLRRTIVIYSAIAVILSGLFSWLAARKGMEPLRAMKKRASIVSGQQLQERMPVHAVPIEMADLAQELNQMLERLQQDFARLSDFSSDLAHELRTPISNLLTQTQVALSSKRDSTTYRDILASNAEELQDMARMVADMLFLAKTERLSDLPSCELFSAASEAGVLMDFYEAVADEKSIQLSAQGDASIRGNRLMFRRALSNLLSNALRHTPTNGVVTVMVKEASDWVEISVENTGQAIDPQLLPRLFDRFFRADPARAHPGSDGAGLGLPIVRAIAQAHRGTVSGRSENGRTVFKMVLPKAF